MLTEAAQNDCPWLGEAVAWLLENRPPEPERLSICHGDFHPMNILVQDGEVTGVIDWPGFKIADPISDMAFTLTVSSTFAGQIMSSPDVEKLMERYLDSYLKIRPASIEHIPYYRVLRCVIALRESAAGQEVWRQPHAVKATTEYIHEITGIRVVPAF